MPVPCPTELQIGHHRRTPAWYDPDDPVKSTVRPRMAPIAPLPHPLPHPVRPIPLPHPRVGVQMKRMKTGRRWSEGLTACCLTGGSPCPAAGVGCVPPPACRAARRSRRASVGADGAVAAAPQSAGLRAAGRCRGAVFLWRRGRQLRLKRRRPSPQLQPAVLISSALLLLQVATRYQTGWRPTSTVFCRN